ncbi:cytochrome P450 [Sporormia fimetaria CBS 119925]|uniref:Cytochrome P450 n=1 Tax=Sporormia fimetaria CBS 119925 TaxID=1340428 RepID=A0A6A6VGB3_9PLEO|nr:cytochrome P450 [Sporormia fimetaria CBS 119925]
MGIFIFLAAPLLFVALRLIQELVFRITKTRFFRQLSSSASGKRPPTVPYHSPGFFHSFGIRQQGRADFLANILAEYDGSAPFVVKDGPLSAHVVVRDPDHITRILEANQFKPEGHHVRLINEFNRSGKENPKAISSNNPVQNKDMEIARSDLPRKYLSGNDSTPLVRNYEAALFNNMDGKMFQVRTWTEIEDLFSFLSLEISRALVVALLGTEKLKRNPRFIRDLMELNKNVDGMERGLPRIMIPKAYDARDSLHAMIVQHLQSIQTCDESVLGGPDDVWNAYRGSKLLRLRDETISKIYKHDDDRAAGVLTFIQQTTMEIAPSAFWCLLEALRDENLMFKLRKEIVPPQYDGGRSFRPHSELRTHPIIQSMQAEVERLRIASCITRTNEGNDFKLDDSWTIPRGARVMILSRPLALDSTLWHRARPQTTQKHLSTFWAERFLVPREDAEHWMGNDLKRKFSLEGLESLMTAFGRGPHVCPGREFAKAIQVATLEVLLAGYEAQLSDPESVELSLPSARTLAYGRVEPLAPVRVRLRKRGPSTPSDPLVRRP